MIIEAARLAGRNLFAPETRSAFWKILGITLVMLVGLWAALRGLFVGVSKKIQAFISIFILQYNMF